MAETCWHCGRGSQAHAKGYASENCVFAPVWIPEQLTPGAPSQNQTVALGEEVVYKALLDALYADDPIWHGSMPSREECARFLAKAVIKADPRRKVEDVRAAALEQGWREGYFTCREEMASPWAPSPQPLTPNPYTIARLHTKEQNHG